MSSLAVNQSDSPFDAIRRIDEQGNEFWSARELMPVLGYQSKWQNFNNSIKKAYQSCQNSYSSVTEHFLLTSVKSDGRPADDWRLSRLACYLVAMNGDPRKIEIAAAQSYFAIKTREAETVIPAQNDRLRELELELELAKTQNALAINQSKLLATVQLLETLSPGLAPLALGRADAIVERVEYVERVIDRNSDRVTEGVGISYIAKRFGFKSTRQAWAWLDSIGFGKDSGLWESQLSAVENFKLPKEMLSELAKKFKKGVRQLNLGE